jgi:hypothetical protein
LSVGKNQNVAYPIAKERRSRFDARCELRATPGLNSIKKLQGRLAILHAALGKFLSENLHPVVESHQSKQVDFLEGS